MYMYKQLIWGFSVFLLDIHCYINIFPKNGYFVLASLRNMHFKLVLSCISSVHYSDDDMISLASMMSVSNLSMIGNLEDDDEDYTVKRL